MSCQGFVDVAQLNDPKVVRFFSQLLCINWLSRLEIGYPLPRHPASPSENGNGTYYAEEVIGHPNHSLTI